MSANYLVLVLTLLVFRSAIALQCHVCAYRTGLQEEELSESEKSFFDKSCKKGNVPMDNFLVNCSASNNSSLEVSCASMKISGFTAPWPTDVEITTRGCLKFPTSFSEGCKDWNQSELLNSTAMPNKLKEYMKQFGESITVQICSCKQDACI